MNRTTIALALALVALAVGDARADFTLLDDFNRGDSGTLGPAWTLRAGSIGVAGGMATVGGAATGMATFDGVASTVVTADLFASPGAGGVASLILGYADQAHFLSIGFVSNADGYFDTTVFRFGADGVNDDAWPNAGIYHNFPAPYSFRSARVTASILGSGLLVQIDANFDGLQDRGVSLPSLPPIGLLGTGIGISASGGARVDNFGTGAGVTTAVPEPSSIVLAAIGGLALAGVAARARRSS